MPIKSKGSFITPKAGKQKASKKKSVKAKVSKSSSSDTGVRRSSRSDTAVRINPSSNRSLRDAGITDKRLEIIAMTDYKPIVSPGNITLAGELFDTRILERKTNLESVLQIINDLSIAEAENFEKALNQYNSALTAAESEFALLKLLLLLQKYSTHSGRFLDFINEYVPPEGLDIDWIDGDNANMLKALCAANFSENQDAATIMIAQTLMAINCSTYGLSPYRLDRYPNNLPTGKLMYQLDASQAETIQTYYKLMFLSRDMTFSREMTRIRDDEEPDESFKELIEEKFGSTFATSPVEIKENILYPFVGTNAYTNMRNQISSQDSVEYSAVENYLDNKQGVFSKLRYENTNILIPETYEVKYGKKTYDTIEPLVDEAFTGDNVLDFSTYNSALEGLVQELQNVSNFGHAAFRLGEKAAESNGSPRAEMPLVATDQPLSPTSLTASILEVFDRRFASTLRRSIQDNKFYDWLTPEHVSYNRTLAWILIKDNPELAKKVISSFINDYKAGFLTPAGLPTPIEGTAEIDSEGNEIPDTEELSPLAYVKPGTDTTVNLTGRGTYLNSRIYRICKYYEEDVRQMSPGSILSTNDAEDVSYPEIRTQYERQNHEVSDYFGAVNPSKSDPDLRLINVISNRVWRKYVDDRETESTAYLGAKIIGAEIIGCVLDVLRSCITPFTDVEASADGDAAFPFVEQMKPPYGTSNWNYSGTGYENFQMNLWVDTVTKWNQLFCRESEKITYMRRRNISAHASRVIDIFSFLMESYNWLEARMETIGPGVVMYEREMPSSHDDALDEKLYFPVCANIKFKSGGSGLTRNDSTVSAVWYADHSPGVKKYCSDVSDAIQTMLSAGFDDWDNAVENIIDGLSSEGAASSSSALKPTPPAAAAVNRMANLLENVYREEKQLQYLYDFVGSYGDRVQNYQNAVMELTEGEGTPLGELITSLRNAGDAGTDVLQSLSVNQMALKQIAMEEEVGDPDNGYLPKLSILSDSEIECVRTMCQLPILTAPEGTTTKVIFVGLPNGIFSKNSIDDEFCLRVSYTDIEYPQLVFRSKSYKFHKDLYVLPTDFDSVSSRVTRMQDILDDMQFSKIRVEVIESDDASASIEIEDDIETLEYDSSNPDIYTNLAVSELLKIYYRLMIGVNMSEIAFLTSPGGVNIEISESLANLGSVLAEKIENSSAASSINIAADISSLMADVKQFENPENFASGELSSVDDALLTDLKNMYQTRLFSPSDMRTNIISAKMFDRIYAIPVDPDEFYIVAPGEAQVGDVETSQVVFDFYKNAGIIEETGLDSPFSYKLAPRKTAEGSMAFGNVTVSLTTVADENERLLGL